MRISDWIQTCALPIYLRQAARRGVDVRLILQGNPDMRWVQWAANTLHDYLLRAGVKIYEYCELPMHAKVALIDDDWTTVGRSEEHTAVLQSLMRISYAVVCLKTNNTFDNKKTT